MGTALQLAYEGEEILSSLPRNWKKESEEEVGRGFTLLPG